MASNEQFIITTCITKAFLLAEASLAILAPWRLSDASNSHIQPAGDSAPGSLPGIINFCDQYPCSCC